ncbi:Structural maintenance of chromosomes protein 5, partial [Rhizophlyctis rosea]
MSSTRRSTRKRQIREEEEEDEAEEEVDVPHTPTRSNGRRGARRDQAEVVPNTPEANGDKEQEDQRPSAKRQRMDARGGPSGKADEFKQGQIVRIRCHNFVTYDDVEVLPGPSLNMIIGPNGTGKSTLVCAIAIALGQSPKVVGRATEVSAYVKEGEDRAWVEIELKGPPGKRNIIIRRSFKKEDNSSTYKLNGEAVTEKAVKEIVISLNIQVDNLCSFLPQDRVSEFARMTTQQLLRATERAVGTVQLTEWHDELIEIRNEELTVQTAIKTLTEDIEKLQQRNANTQRDVDRFNERAVLLEEIKKLELKIAHQKFIERRDEFVVARDEKDAKKQTVVEILQQLDPMQQECEALEERLENAKEEAKNVGGTRRELVNKLENLKTKFGECEQQGDDLRNQFASIRKRELARQQQLAKLNEMIAKLHSDAEKLKQTLLEWGMVDSSGRTNTDPQHYAGELRSLTDQITEMNAALNGIRAQVEDLQDEQKAFQADADRIRQQRRRLQEELVGLDNVQLQKMTMLQRMDRNMYQATLWLKDHRHMFKMPVYDPAALEINVKDPRYAAAVETVLSRQTMLSFITLCQEDYKMLGDELIEKQGLRLNIIYYDGGPVESYQRQFGDEE